MLSKPGCSTGLGNPEDLSSQKGRGGTPRFFTNQESERGFDGPERLLKSKPPEFPGDQGVLPGDRPSNHFSLAESGGYGSPVLSDASPGRVN